MTDDPVLQTVPLGAQWPTIDPFLFCAHHLDAFPEGDGSLGPAASTEGRQIGMDFAGIDGWNLYHGDRVPGFPVHPHRGFETVTYVRSGIVDHSDSLGATARFGRGDVQWLTAGGGIQHAEMMPLLDTTAPNPLELFQIWLNLPADDKFVDAHFTMFWDRDIPKYRVESDRGAAATVTVIAGTLPGTDTPPAPPPSSWASRPDAGVAIWHLHLEPGATWTMPAAADVVRTLYVFDGTSLRITDHDTPIERGTGALVDPTRALDLSSEDGVDVLILAGRPIGEPVARHGPFVMNTEAEIHDAVRDYQQTRFGGWPWPNDDPTHGADAPRFARHADGRIEFAEPDTDPAP